MGKRIRAQRKGSSPRYRVASHRFPGKNRMPRDKDVVCEVTELVHSPVHSAPLARIKTPDGDTTLVAATEGIAVGSKVAIGDNVALRPGNITEIGNIPEGTAVNNLELRPGDGGKVASHFATVSGTEFKVVDGRSFWDVTDFGDVSGAEGNVVTNGDLAANSNAFGGSHQGRVTVGRLDASEWGGVDRAVNQLGDLTNHIFVAGHPVLTGESVARHAVAWRGTFALCTNSLTHDNSPQNAPRRIAASSAS